MFSWWSFRCYLNTRFHLCIALDNVVDLLSLVGAYSWECFFDLDNFRCANILFQSLGIQFLRLFSIVSQFDVLEVFGDLVNLLLGFGRNRRGNFFNICQSQFINDLIFVSSGLNFWSELCHNFLSKRVRLFVSIERIPVSWINKGNEILHCFTHTMKVLKIVGFWWINLFVRNILSHKVQEVFDIFWVQC